MPNEKPKNKVQTARGLVEQAVALLRDSTLKGKDRPQAEKLADHLQADLDEGIKS